MSKNYKIRKKKEEIEEIDESTLSKKELYDLNKKKKEEEKKKSKKKKEKKATNNKKKTKTYQTNIAGRIFAIIMLILMVGSVIATIAAHAR